MVFSWFRNRHRAELLEQPFPDAWMEFLQANVPQYADLATEEQKQLCDDIRVFIAEKNWEGCGGQRITDEVQVTIAAYACLLILNIKHDYYPDVESILVYPSGYDVKNRVADASGVVDEAPAHLLGEAWKQGPVVLSWVDALVGGQDSKDGHNVVLHEFAHKLDLLDGAADGVPRLESDGDYDRWSDVMSAEYEMLVQQSEQGKASLLDSYGATNAAEFFAVATECFFEKPGQMLQSHARLYEVMKAFYRQDPAARATGRQGVHTADALETVKSLINHH